MMMYFNSNIWRVWYIYIYIHELIFNTFVLCQVSMSSMQESSSRRTSLKGYIGTSCLWDHCHKDSPSSGYGRIFEEHTKYRKVEWGAMGCMHRNCSSVLANQLDCHVDTYSTPLLRAPLQQILHRAYPMESNKRRRTFNLPNLCKILSTAVLP